MDDKRLITDSDIKRLRRTATTGWSKDILDHCDAVNERLEKIEQLTTEPRVLKMVREILYGKQ